MELMHFHSRRTEISDSAKVQILDSNVITGANGIQWLGVWFDRKLDLKHHVQTKATSALKAFTGIFRLASTEKALSFQALRQDFQIYISTISDFEAEVWWKGRLGLNRIILNTKNAVMRKIAGAFRTTPIAVLEAETAIPPTAIGLYEMQRKYAIRILSMPPTHPPLDQCPST